MAVAGAVAYFAALVIVDKKSRRLGSELLNWIV